MHVRTLFSHYVENPLFDWKRKKERRTEAFFPSLLLNGFLFHVIDFHRDLPFTQKRGPAAAAAHYYSVVVVAAKKRAQMQKTILHSVEICKFFSHLDFT